MRRAGHGSRWVTLAAALLVVVSAAAGCSNALPPEAIVNVPPPPPPPITPEEGKRLIVGVDDLGTGFNPHLISDQSPTSTAVASLVLPSVFRPGPGGEPRLDTTVASSATVVSTAPFTVSYELNLAAAWSDNTPIAAEDFVYLWQRMRTEPAVVDAAGYRLITDVRSRAGGKAVDVVFAQPYPQWQRLFSNLLPAHLLKDAPRSWATALTDSIPVSGGPFAVSALDRARGQLVLARNDHYWATPAVLDSLVLRRVEPTGLLDGLRGGDLPVAQVWPDQVFLTAIRQLGPNVRLQGVAQPIVVQLGMRTDQGVLSDLRVRQAVGAALNRDALIAVGTGNGAGGVRADAQLRAPSEPGYHPTAPAGAPVRPDPGLVNSLLTAAGYTRNAQGRWSQPSGPLRVTIGVPADRPRFLEIGQEAARQLDAAGIDVQVVTAPGASLYADPTVVPLPQTSTSPSAPAGASASPSAVGASTPGNAPARPNPAPPPAQGPPPAVPASGPAAPRVTGIPGVPGPGAGHAGAQGHAAAPGHAGVPGQSTTPGAPPSGTPSPSPTAAPPPAAPAGVVVDLEVMPRALGADPTTTAISNYGCPPGMAGVAQPARNATGFCSVALQPLLDATLAGAMSPDQSGNAIESLLWQQLPVIPLFQMVTTVASTATGDQATGQIGPGPLTIGPFGTAATWQPLPR